MKLLSISKCPEKRISLMLEKGCSVSVAAYSVGYTDVCNFSKMFKKHYGISPREYAVRKSLVH